MISNTVIANTETTIVTVSSSKTYATVGITFCNTSTAAEIITVYAVAGGGAGADSKAILKDLTIQAKDTYTFETKLIMTQTDKLSAIGTTGNVVTATLSYMEI